jgi:hypothetical protein
MPETKSVGTRKLQALDNHHMVTEPQLKQIECCSKPRGQLEPEGADNISKTIIQGNACLCSLIV